MPPLESALYEVAGSGKRVHRGHIGMAVKLYALMLAGVLAGGALYLHNIIGHEIKSMVVIVLDHLTARDNARALFHDLEHSGKLVLAKAVAGLFSRAEQLHRE